MKLKRLIVLEEILEKHGKNNDEVWSTITTNQGSVSHLDFLTEKNHEHIFFNLTKLIYTHASGHVNF